MGAIITGVQPCKRPFLPAVGMQKRGRSSVGADGVAMKEDKQTRRGSLVKDKDNWFDRLAINHLTQALQASSGMRSNKSGYQGLVETSRMISRGFSSIQQRQLVNGALQAAFPTPILSKIKAVLPQSKFAREFSAFFTTIFLAWLVGPCQVKESEFQGRKEKNVVHIPKCRFLEETNCVGMCTNLCKMPSQTFVKDSLGIPINMVPNFEDMSCDIIYGEEPPPESLDPAFKVACYQHCNKFM